MCNPTETAGSASAGKGVSGKLLTVTIRGVTYDISGFKHPGGGIIRYLASKEGEDAVDATHAFTEFHFRNQEKVERYLKSLPVVDTPEKKAVESPKHQALSADFIKLRRDLEERGFFKPSPLHIAYRNVEIVLMFAASFVLFQLSLQKGSFVPGAGLYAVAAIINGIAQGRCGWLMHEGGHFSLTGWKRADLFLQEVLYGVGCGMSGGWWRNQHNKHHATPQKLKHDVDLDTLPLVAFNTKVRAHVKPSSLMGRWLALQAYVFAPVSCFLVGLFWTLFLHPRHILVRTKNKMELACILFRYLGWYALMTSFGFTPLEALKAYLLSFGIGCTYIFLNFAVSHTHLPVSGEDEYLHWVEYAGLHTTNVSCNSKFIGWWMSYLNFQIEHHLFPSMPQFRHPKVSPMVRELFEKHGIRYDERSYVQAMRDTFANLHEVGTASADDIKVKQ